MNTNTQTTTPPSPILGPDELHNLGVDAIEAGKEYLRAVRNIAKVTSKTDEGHDILMTLASEAEGVAFGLLEVTRRLYMVRQIVEDRLDFDENGVPTHKVV